MKIVSRSRTQCVLGSVSIRVGFTKVSFEKESYSIYGVVFVLIIVATQVAWNYDATIHTH